MNKLRKKKTGITESEAMSLAYKEALKAAAKNEVPVGAIALFEGELLAKAHNLKESKMNALGHAEILLISKISKKLKRWRLDGVEIYVTLEPCLMCMGALIQARISKLVFGCYDPKGGGCGSLYDFSRDNRLNHRVEVVSGLLADESSRLLSSFFSIIRQKKGKF